MPDVGTPQAPWRDDEDWAGFVRTFDDANMRFDLDEASGLAVAADRRVWAATLRAKIEAEFEQEREVLANTSAYHHTDVNAARGSESAMRRILAVLDAVLGGDS